MNSYAPVEKTFSVPPPTSTVSEPEGVIAYVVPEKTNWVMLTVSPSASWSFLSKPVPARLPVRVTIAASSATVSVSLTATGASLTAVTVTLIRPEPWAEGWARSSMRYVNCGWAPLRFAAGT